MKNFRVFFPFISDPRQNAQSAGQLGPAGPTVGKHALPNLRARAGQLAVRLPLPRHPQPAEPVEPDPEPGAERPARVRRQSGRRQRVGHFAVKLAAVAHDGHSDVAVHRSAHAGRHRAESVGRGGWDVQPEHNSFHFDAPTWVDRGLLPGDRRFYRADFGAGLFEDQEAAAGRGQAASAAADGAGIHLVPALFHPE